MQKIRSAAAVLLIIICVFMLVSCKTEPKTFTYGEFTIRLDSGFKEVKNDSAVAFLASSKYSVICVKEEFSSLENGGETTILEYAEIIKNNYPEYNAEIKSEGDFCYLEYENKAEHKNFYYNSYLFKKEDAFYTVHFATASKSDNSESASIFAEWAKTIELNNE